MCVCIYNKKKRVCVDIYIYVYVCGDCLDKYINSTTWPLRTLTYIHTFLYYIHKLFYLISYTHTHAHTHTKP